MQTMMFTERMEMERVERAEARKDRALEMAEDRKERADDRKERAEDRRMLTEAIAAAVRGWAEGGSNKRKHPDAADSDNE